MIGLIADALAPDGAERIETIRISEHNIPGVKSDEGPGDAWPELRRRILSADILIFRTPIWLANRRALAKRVYERMDAFFSEMDDQGRPPAFGNVAVAASSGTRMALITRHSRAVPGARRCWLDDTGNRLMLLDR